MLSIDDDGFVTDSGMDADEVNDVALLTQFWLNERSSPDILQYQGDVVERVLELVRAQQDNVESLGVNEDEELAERNVEFLRIVYIQELERVQFVLRSYLRTRICKIEEQTASILSRPQYRALLSETELEYAEKFNEMTNANYRKSFLEEACPPSLQNPDDAETVVHPKLSQSVFCTIKKNLGSHLLPNGNTVDLDADRVFLIKYNTVKPFVETGDVQLL